VEQEVIVEMEVALAILLENHNQDTLIKAALTEFSESRFVASIGSKHQ
jgi:hypothetical protein